jgi:hypothetical protein
LQFLGYFRNSSEQSLEWKVFLAFSQLTQKLI